MNCLVCNQKTNLGCIGGHGLCNKHFFTKEGQLAMHKAHGGSEADFIYDKEIEDEFNKIIKEAKEGKF